MCATGEFLLPLLTVPKAADPLINVFLQGLMHGSVQDREHAAECMAEVARITDPTVLKPLLIKATGPLIRVIGERYPSSVKAAILQASFGSSSIPCFLIFH